MAIKIDFSAFSLGEIEEFEGAGGITFEKAVESADTNKMLPTKALIAAVWITQRRDDPNYTLDDARSVKLTDFSEPEPPNPPTDAGGS